MRATLNGLHHICPNCGDAFRGYAAAVFCSRSCAHSFGKMQRRGSYPSIATLPVDERNKLAHLISLARRANQIIYTYE